MLSEVETARSAPEVSLSRVVLRRQLATLAVPARTAAILAGLPPGPGHLDAACAAATAVLERLVNALVSDETDEQVYREAVAALSGLGPGLTPTGDDLLVAMLVAGHRLCEVHLLGSVGLAGLERAVVTSPSGRTTFTARYWLAEACHGRAPAPLAQFVEALGNRKVADDDLVDRCARLVTTGAHSGADWLAGVITLCTRCCQPDGEQSSASHFFQVPIQKPELTGRGTLPSPLSPLPCPLESHRE